VLNLISAAEEMNVHTDFAAYTRMNGSWPLTPLNANVRHISPRYGEQVNQYYLRYEQ
jgi:hypothetical protein